MKTMYLTTALVACLALPAMAQTTASPFQTEAAGPSISASDVIGARVYVSEAAVDADAYNGVQEGWNDVGEVNDIILGRDGTVDAVLVDIGGFLGMGERQVAVDMSALKIVQDDATDADDWFLVLQTDRATLEGAPPYVVPGMATTGAATNTDAAATETAATDTAAAPAADGSTTATATDTTATDMATAPAAGSMALPEGYTAVERTGLTAETLTGASVHDASDRSIAEVQDLVLTSDGQVTDVVLDVGGFLGIGAKRVAIPLDRLTVAKDDGGAVRLWVNMTKEELQALPDYAK